MYIKYISCLVFFYLYKEESRTSISSLANREKPQTFERKSGSQTHRSTAAEITLLYAF